MPNYYGVGHASLDNYIAMISGQAPNASTQADCGVFANFATAGPLGSSASSPATAASTRPTVPDASRAARHGQAHLA